MADYSGHHDPISVHLTDIWLKKGGVYCWGSFKDFIDGPCTFAPRPFLGLLIDGNREGYERNRDFHRRMGWESPTFQRAHITWNTRRKEWQMVGGYRFSDVDTRLWLQRNGWLDENFKLLKPIDSEAVQLELSL